MLRNENQLLERLAKLSKGISIAKGNLRERLINEALEIQSVLNKVDAFSDPDKEKYTDEF